KSLPDDFTATGEVSAAFGFHSRAGVHDFHGTGNTSPFLLQTAAAEKAFPVSAIRFHMGPPDTPGLVATRKKKKKEAAPSPPAAPTAAFQPSALTFDAFSVQMGATTLELQGNLDSVGYFASAKGMVPMERLLAFGRATGFPSNLGNATASAQVDFSIAGAWANPVPAKLQGTARLQNLAAWIPGIKDRLLLSEAEAQITDATLTLNHVTGQFEHSPIGFTGSVASPLNCPGDSACPLEFDLHFDNLAVADVATVLGFSDKGWNLPFISGSENKLPDFRATGTVPVGQLTVAEIPLHKLP